MMGYTHAIVGAMGAIGLALISPNPTPEIYMIAAVAGTVGGVAVDIDSRDQRNNPKVTDAGRSRIAAISVLIVGVLIDYVFKFGTIQAILSSKYSAIGGILGFLILMLLGHFSEHRTFSHSLLFVLLTSFCIFCIYPDAMQYYCIGAMLHLLLDMLNHPYRNHGVYLLYPIKKRKGVALGICKAARKGNKALYFAGLVLYLILSGLYMYQIFEIKRIIPSSIIMVCIITAMELVRKKSEKEQRHIMHIRGEL